MEPSTGLPAQGLRVDRVTVHFGGVRALHGVSAEFRKGELTGLIGPNGSGKTTLLNVISGYLEPNAGSVTWLGSPLDLGRPQAAARAGIVRTFQDGQLLERETVVANLEWAGEAYRSNGAVAEFADLFRAFRHASVPQQARELLRQYGLERWQDTPVSNCSSGVRNLLAIICSRMTPRARAGDRLYLFDEPFAGVADALIELLIAEMRSLASAGATVVVVDHRLSHMQRLCRQLVVLHSGELLTAGRTEDALRHPAVLAAYVGKHQ